MKWICLEKEKPQLNERVLFYWPEGDNKKPCFIFGYYDGKDFLTEDNTLLVGSWEVTHWLRIPPLPEPPKGFK